MSQGGYPPGVALNAQSADLFGNSGAVLSDCERYRYRLWRRWGNGPSVVFVMLNPSTADAEKDDPTIRRCIGFAQRWGAGALEVCNLYAWRATNPHDLPPMFAVSEPTDLFRNDWEIHEAVKRSSRVIAAWGAHEGPARERGDRVMRHLLGDRVEALALTKNGRPRHPLYVRGDAEPFAYPGLVAT